MTLGFGRFGPTAGAPRAAFAPGAAPATRRPPFSPPPARLPALPRAARGARPRTTFAAP